MAGRGEVYFVPIKVEGKGGKKIEHPLIVVENTALLASTFNAVLVVPMSSSTIGHPVADRFTQPIAKVRNNFLDHDSYAHCARLGSIARSSLGSRAGVLHADDLRQVELKILAALGIVP